MRSKTYFSVVSASAFLLWSGLLTRGLATGPQIVTPSEIGQEVYGSGFGPNGPMQGNGQNGALQIDVTGGAAPTETMIALLHPPTSTDLTITNRAEVNFTKMLALQNQLQHLTDARAPSLAAANIVRQMIELEGRDAVLSDQNLAQLTDGLVNIPDVVRQYDQQRQQAAPGKPDDYGSAQQCLANFAQYHQYHQTPPPKAITTCWDKFHVNWYGMTFPEDKSGQAQRQNPASGGHGRAGHRRSRGARHGRRATSSNRHTGKWHDQAVRRGNTKGIHIPAPPKGTPPPGYNTWNFNTQKKQWQPANLSPLAPPGVND